MKSDNDDESDKKRVERLQVDKNGPDGELKKKLSQIIDDLNFEVQSDLQTADTTMGGGSLGRYGKGGTAGGPQELTNEERRFLLSVERGDAPSVRIMLDSASGASRLNINCADSLGRNALHIAIENEHTEMLQLLLGHPGLEIGDSLLHAISEENVEAVEIILAAMARRPKKKDLMDLLGNSSSTFTSDITPLILAAHRDNYPIIKILLDRGDSIPKPHDLRCSCHDCVASQKEDSLRHSRSRINAYRALASPSLICLSSKDPILTAFELSAELKRLGSLENEFKDDYESLADQCQQFAKDLLAQTRGSTELAIILNHDHGQVNNTNIHPAKIDSPDEQERMSLSRLKLAIKYKQKSFVSHPHCQQLLASLWYEGLPGIRRMPFIHKSIMVGLLCSSFPGLSSAYIMLPKSRFGKLIKNPFIKFLCHQSSYFLFLIFLILSAIKAEDRIFGTFELRLTDRGPAASYTEYAIIIYLTGFVWQEIKQLYSNGLRNYLADMWNLLDFATNSLYISVLALRVTAFFNVHGTDQRYVSRRYWESFEPVLISECLFAFANIFSTLKIVFIFTINPRLGPLQISLGRMLGDVLNFFSLYLLVLIAYSFGMLQLLWFYSHERQHICQNNTFSFTATGTDLERYQYCTTRGRFFTNIFEIVQSLYWTAYGLIDLTNFNLEYNHVVTEFIGKLMLGSFCYITVLMLFNMFIAMMNNSYQLIYEKSDMEWKFARSKMWISFFEEGATVPVPFNIIPSPKSMYYLLITLKHMFCSCTESHNRSKWKSIRKIVKKVNEKEARHQAVVKDLIKRYLVHRQKAEENQGVTEDDLNEIKGDISSFRFELIEILQMNGMKTPTDMNKRNAGKLRRRFSKRGFNRIVRDLNPEKTKNGNSEDNEKDDKLSHSQLSQVTRIFSNSTGQLPQSNGAVVINNNSKDSGINFSIPEDEEISQRITEQPLNVANLLKQRSIPQIRRSDSAAEISINLGDTSPTRKKDPQEPPGNQRSDMV